MKMFSDCSGHCYDCLLHYLGGCWAGHGDDDFIQITEKRAKEFLNGGKLNDNKIEQLKERFP